MKSAFKFHEIYKKEPADVDFFVRMEFASSVRNPLHKCYNISER